MPTFPRGHNTHQLHAQNGELIRNLQPATTTPARITWTLTAADALTLRGIPVVGLGVAGQIPGTRPGI